MKKDKDVLYMHGFALEFHNKRSLEIGYYYENQKHGNFAYYDFKKEKLYSVTYFEGEEKVRFEID